MSESDKGMESLDSEKSGSTNSSTKRSFRRSTSEKSRAILESTKNVGSRIEKSFKSVLRRKTISETSDDVVTGSKNEEGERCSSSHSIPASEVFEAITFDFPLLPINSHIFHSSGASNTTSSHTESPIRIGYTDSSTDDSEYSTEPPEYPPPPPPTHFLSSQEGLEGNQVPMMPSWSNSIFFQSSDQSVHVGNDACNEGVWAKSVFRATGVEDIGKNFAGSNSTSWGNAENSETAFKTTNRIGRRMELVEDFSNNSNSYENWNMPSATPLESVLNEFDPLKEVKDDKVTSVAIDGAASELAYGISSISIQAELEQEAASPTSVDKNDLSEPSAADADREGEKGKKHHSGAFHTLRLKACRFKLGGGTAAASLAQWSSMSRRMVKSVKSSVSGTDIEMEPKVITLLHKPKIHVSASAVLHNSFLMKTTSTDKNFAQRWCQLSEQKLFFSPDKATTEKEFIDLNAVLSIQIITNQKSTNNDGEDLYCFSVNVLNRSRSHIFGAMCTTERRIWMQKLLENMTPSFSSHLTTDFSRAGWCFMKESIGGDWMPTWILLRKRTLVYAPAVNGPITEVDLRKVRYIDSFYTAQSLQVIIEGLQDTKDETISAELKPIMLLDAVSQSLYIAMGKHDETAEWQRAIRIEALDNGIHLGDQQLTRDDVPVIVDKCISFIYAHGIMSEGIYRRSGSNSSVTSLLSQFRKDAWAVQISRKEYTEHDVANVLKRFFRDLPEPLLSVQLHKHLCNVPGVDCSEEDKLSSYRSILEKLMPVNYVTMRKLIGHLFAVQEQQEKNLMPIANLSSIWGPTLMHVESNDSHQWSKRESDVLFDLITLYPKLFLIDEEELQRENRIRQVMEKYHAFSTQFPPSAKPSGDLKMWIFLRSKDSGECVNVTVDPNKSCSSVCKELAPRMGVASHLLCLNEVICGEQLRRPMHHTEHVLDTVLRWSYWDENDRKDNYLVLTTDSILAEVHPTIKTPLVTISGDLKFADRKSKSFKNYPFEYSHGNLLYYRDKKSCHKVQEWKVQDLVWYLGYETKRDPSSRWALTFINKNEKQNRTRDSPFFGYTMAGINKEEEFKWISAFLVAQYPISGILPEILLLD